MYENAYTIDISKLAKGYYAMRITTAEGVAVRKVIRK
ncbi:MAG: T9SS type A sorting domain-containing protein [Bacteroidales bacterium]|nr:T9SS type A sorting domain-containing protein [Bacteroidales bacterium]MBR7168556.1 T9SS type A sorting domain-containing protein [Bacteroidales bacterium]